MSDDSAERSRRRILRATGAASLLGIAGCVTIGEREGDVQLEDMRAYPKAEERGEREPLDINEPVPDVEAECVSIDGVQRDPTDIAEKADVAYQESPFGYQLCANCRFFCPSQTTDPVGACTEVVGRIASQHWCALWEPLEGADLDPNPTSTDHETGSIQD